MSVRLAEERNTDIEPPPGPQLTAWAVGLGLIAASVWLFLTPHAAATLYERDLPAYQGAIDAFAAGHDPYTASQVKRAHGLPFIGPPFVWMLYKAAAHTGLKAGFSGLLMIGDAVSVIAIPTILSRLFLGRGVGRVVLGLGFFFAAFLGSGVFSALVANNGTLLYALIAVGLVPAVLRGRWWPFHLAVALATAFKPFYAAFWLVPLLADAEARRQWAPFVLGVGVAAASYLVPMFAAPKLMAEWTHTLVQQVVSDDRLGDNLLGAMTSQPAWRHAPATPYAATLAFSAVLVAASLMLGRLDRRARIAGLVLAAVFLNPRAMRYDLSMAAIPLLAVVCTVTSRGRPGDIAQSIWAVILAAAMIVFSADKPADGFLYAGICVLALAAAIAVSWTTPRRKNAYG